jgi:hypothetical protein
MQGSLNLHLRGINMINSKEVQFTVKIDGETRDTLYAKLSPLGFHLHQTKLLWSSASHTISRRELQAGETRVVISSGHPTGIAMFLLLLLQVRDRWLPGNYVTFFRFL